MAFRHVWKGYLKLSLVSVPVKSYSAVSSQEGEVHFHQLHEPCHNRIKYVKTCPVHGAVPPSEIVSGYEYEKGHYVVVSPDELESLRQEEEKVVNVESVVPMSAIDPIYLTDRSSYLVPDGAVAQKPYILVAESLSQRTAMAIARWVKNGKDEVVGIRSVKGVLLMTVLSNAVQVKSPDTFAGEIPKSSSSPEERKLTNMLMDAFAQDEIDLSQFREHYTDRVSELIQAKVQGKQVVRNTAQSGAPVVNLMDALRESIGLAKLNKSTKDALLTPKKRSYPSNRKERGA